MHLEAIELKKQVHNFRHRMNLYMKCLSPKRCTPEEHTIIEQSIAHDSLMLFGTVVFALGLGFAGSYARLQWNIRIYEKLYDDYVQAVREFSFETEPGSPENKDAADEMNRLDTLVEQAAKKLPPSFFRKQSD